MQARREAVLLARQWLAWEPVFLDTETTGLTDRDEVCDVAVIDAAGGVLVDSLVRPGIAIPPAASSVHGITGATVANAPGFAGVWPALAAALTGRHVVVYNLDFDIARLAQSARAAGLAAEWAPLAAEAPLRWHCAMKLYAQFYGDWSRTRRGYRFHRLAVAAGQCGLPLPPDLHRARADAELTRRLVAHMAAASA